MPTQRSLTVCSHHLKFSFVTFHSNQTKNEQFATTKYKEQFCSFSIWTWVRVVVYGYNSEVEPTDKKFNYNTKLYILFSSNSLKALDCSHNSVKTGLTVLLKVTATFIWFPFCIWVRFVKEWSNSENKFLFVHKY